MKAFLVSLATVAFALMAVCGERPEGEGLDAEGGHTDRTPASTTYPPPPRKKDGEGQESGCNDRPRHDPTLDVDWVRENGCIAPYTCRTFTSVRDVDIEHIVAWAEARRSGLSCADARAFVNDPLNITVAYPRLNRQQKSDKDIADWQPPRNACWFAARVKAVKAKYGLTMDDRERRALDAVLSGCSPAERASWRCQQFVEPVETNPEITPPLRLLVPGSPCIESPSQT